MRELELKGEYARIYKEILTDGSEVYSVAIRGGGQVSVPARNFECAQEMFNAIEKYSC